MKRLTILCLCVALLLSLPFAAHAKNFDVVPTSNDQIEVGDTYGKGDGELKIFDKDGNLIIHKKGKIDKSIISIKSTQFDNGNYGGVTDAWWYYYIFGWLTGSGPKAEGTTYTYAHDGNSDYLSAYVKLYVNGTKKAEDSASDTDVGEVTAYCDHLYYSNVGGPILPCRATTSHKVIDSKYGWNASFTTDDSF
ncbi:hypothetical protein L7E55_07035 [Pelotomaculum isophthalicicum JI]|uniref:Uncharacterized protein n=1 Tax=Pelotomaculum isophthalicicum JI TaxID=947010 RepID=A0A9X4H1I7_9FIRM|nr:hypothetical protein [Pelotomaculum isophthalicicum]MDF9408115.1 hypothetical protein [Pelotomaculum isophthalicicum JI]